MFGTASCQEWLCQDFIEIFGERKKSVGMTNAASKFEWFSRHGNWHVTSAPCAWHSLYLLLLVFHHPSLFHSRLKTFLFSWFVPPYTGSLHFFFWIDYMNYSSDCLPILLSIPVFSVFFSLLSCWSVRVLVGSLFQRAIIRDWAYFCNTNAVMYLLYLLLVSWDRLSNDNVLSSMQHVVVRRSRLGWKSRPCSQWRRFMLVLHTHTHPFNGPLSGTTQVSRYQKGKTNLDFTEARDSEWQWHQLGRMQVCTSLQTDNHASTPPLTFLQAGCPSCRPTNSVEALKACYMCMCMFVLPARFNLSRLKAGPTLFLIFNYLILQGIVLLLSGGVLAWLSVWS